MTVATGIELTARTFDDRFWNNGPARLGYGGDGERTTVSYGQNPNAKFITTWFRKAFTASGPAVFDGLLLRLLRDDGAVVYLNGTEIYRNHIQPGLVSWNSLATATVDGPAEQTPIEVRLGPAGLLAGTNVIAVEIHQASVASSDLAFDLALIGLRDTNTSEGIYLTSPSDGAHFNAPGSVPLSSYAVASEPITLVEYFDGAMKIGEAATPPFTATWNGASVGTHSLTARATYGAGSTLTNEPVTVAVGEPPTPVTPVFVNLIPARSTWRYWDNVAVSNGWQRTNFNDAAWPSAPARLGFGLDGEATPLNEGRTTYYFRRWFNVANPALLNQLVFQLARDDGAVVYLNGVEVFRSNLPGGPVASSTLALNTANTPDETTYFETILASAGSGLLGGSNLVAVELHQASANSSDAGFDLQLLGYGTTEARVVLAHPASSGFYRIGEQIPLEASVWNSSPLVVTNVEFFVGGQKLSQTAIVPYRSSLTSTNYGTSVFTASATFSDGTRIDSDPTTISVSHDPVFTTLVASNSVWKYLDTGANLGTLWTQTNYVETGWKSGAARLGYGGDGEVTLVSYGPSSSSKYITTYFRRTIVITPGFIYTNLTFRLVRDDGAVVWLNGRELYRSNMPNPPTTITSATVASSAIGNADEQTFFATALAVPALPPGTNVFAVEIHQSAANSSDLGFDLEVVGNGYIEGDPQPQLTVRFEDQMVELSWPASAVGWQVFTASTATTPGNAWTPLGGPHSGERPLFHRGATSQGQQFFRLGRP
jgi:hypothetical protein